MLCRSPCTGLTPRYIQLLTLSSVAKGILEAQFSSLRRGISFEDYLEEAQHSQPHEL